MKFRRSHAERAAPGLVLLCILCLAPAARADLGVPIEIRLTTPPNAIPLPGQMVQATLELEADVELVVGDVAVESGRTPLGDFHWDPVLVDVPVDVLLSPGVAQSFDVRVIANDPTQPIDIVLRAGDRTVSRRFFVLPPQSFPAQRISDSVSIIGIPTRQESPAEGGDPAIDLFTEPLPLEETEVLARADVDADPAFDDESGLERGVLLRVQGQFLYQRNGDDIIPVDGATVLVMDADSGDDDFLGSGVTKADGTFDFQVFKGSEAQPDVYLIFLAGNGSVSVRSFYTPFAQPLEALWTTQTNVIWNVSGSTVDFGNYIPPVMLPFDANAAFHNLSTLTKAWRYVMGLNYGSALTRINVVVPAGGDNSFYKRGQETIYMNFGKQWQEDTTIHEFGHHWINKYGAAANPEYCNPGGYQDPPDKDCGHNQWCAENQAVAWSEGFANFLADMTIRWIEANYHDVVNGRDLELVQQCSEAGFYTDPYKTESIFGAFLRDIADNVNEDDDAFANEGVDKLAAGTSSVLQVAANFNPSTSSGFITFFLSTGIGLGNDVWSTAANNGFDIDGDAPSVPTNLDSPSHDPFVLSTDGTVDLTWTAATDAVSGVRRYYVRAAPTASYPFPEDSFVVTGTSATTPELGPGTWWISVLSEDWSGKQSGNYATFGPVEIEEPDPADFAMLSGRSWPDAVVPRRTEDTTPTYAPLPNFLAGDQNATWFNYRVENVGGLANDVFVYNQFRVDGELTFVNTIPLTVPLGGGQSRIFYNQGPYTVRGGRHALEAWTDAMEVMPEANEVDNRRMRQYVWAPTVLVNDPADRAAPPNPYAGLSNTNPFVSVNCDGLSYIGNLAPFTGLAVVPDSEREDVDLRSHPHTTGPTNGFDLFSTLATSYRGAGGVDAVFTNSALDPIFVVDVGIRRFDSMNNGYRAFPLASTTLPTGVDTPVTLAPGQYVSLHDFTIPTNFGTDHGVVRVQYDPADGPLSVALIEPDVAHVGLDGIDLVGTSRALSLGIVTIAFTYTEPLHGLVLYRDRPEDGSEPRSITATVNVAPAPANFLAATGLAGWAAPVVPTRGGPGTAGSVPAPVALDGGVANTYVNVAAANDALNPGVPLEIVTRVDGSAGPGAQTSGIVAGGTLTRNFPTPITVRGGRHTLWSWLDPNDLVDEADEADNLWGRQWVWSPTTLSAGPAVSLAAPGDAIGGLDAVSFAKSGPFHFNCVGLRDAAPSPSADDGHWQAVAVMPGAGSDVDVRLHDVSPGVFNGFRQTLTSSTWGVGRSDYVLTNFRAVSAKPMDVGVVAVSGSENFDVQAVRSTFLASQPEGAYGDFVLAPSELLALHEVELQAGPISIDLVAVEGNVDWGVTLHRANLPYHSKSLSPSSPSASANGPGLGEQLVFDVPEDARYCVAVWKATSADLPVAGTYRLDFGDGATDVPPSGELVRSGLSSVRPNPFNPRTVVHFDLAESGPVALRVYDVRGAVVRSLVDATMPPGRHQTTWNGTDDQGRRVASGVYFIRLDTPGVLDVRKAVLLK